MCCKFFNPQEKTDDYHRISVPASSANYRTPDTINLLNVPTPENVDIMLKPQ